MLAKVRPGVVVIVRSMDRWVAHVIMGVSIVGQRRVEKRECLLEAPVTAPSFIAVRKPIVLVMGHMDTPRMVPEETYLTVVCTCMYNLWKCV